MRIDFYASERQYADHLVPIWNTLGEDERGLFHAHGTVYEHLILVRGVNARQVVRGRPTRARPNAVCTASYQDARMARWRPVALLEHGAGQTYGDDHPSNPGGTSREFVDLFLCPNPSVARKNSEKYGVDKVKVVGSPRVEWLKNHIKVKGEEEVKVTVGFHWDNRQVPESRWAFPWMAPGIMSLKSRWPVVGHSHPKTWKVLEHWYTERGIECEQEFDRAIWGSWIYVCDNSSTMYEAAALGIPVVCMNAPWYRKDKEWGLRFWDAVPGPQVDESDELMDAVQRVLDHPDPALEIGAEVVHRVHPIIVGASLNAANALRELSETSKKPMRMNARSNNPYASGNTAGERVRRRYEAGT